MIFQVILLTIMILEIIKIEIAMTNLHRIIAKIKDFMIHLHKAIRNLKTFQVLMMI